jgi:hypothetical protein
MQRNDAIRLLLRLMLFVPIAAMPVMLNWKALQPDSRVDTGLRRLNAELIRKLRAKSEVLVLGGSRAMRISPEWFEPKTALNAAVLGGGMDDAIAIFELCLETAKTPDVVVLEVNPRLVHESATGDWRTIVPLFNRALERYRLSRPLRWYYRDLASFVQFRPGLLALVQEALFFYRPGHMDLTPSQSDAQISRDLALLGGESLLWRTQSQPGEFELKLFHCFLDDLQSRHIRVVVFLAPVHPIAYDFYTKRGGYQESWIRREMISRGITVVGSYSPWNVGATRDDFFDGVHPRPGIVQRLLREAGVIAPWPQPVSALLQASNPSLPSPSPLQKSTGRDRAGSHSGSTAGTSERGSQHARSRPQPAS